MKSLKYLYYIITFTFLFLLNSCQSDTTYSGSDDVLLNGPITHNLDTAVGYCYQMAVRSFEERIEVQIRGNKISGSGIRVFSKNQKRFRLQIEGMINDDQAEVSIHATENRKENNSFVHTETWVLSESELTVKNRNITGAKGEYTYVRTNCNSYKNKDSIRFDSFNGFFEGYAVVSKNGLYGLVNKKMELTIPTTFKDLGIVNEGSIVFYDQNAGLKGLMDVNGNILVEAKYSEIHCFNEGLAAFLNEEGLWGFMDKKLKVVIKPQFMGVNFFLPDPNRHPFNEGLANVQGPDNKWNYINTKGDFVIRGDFLFSESFKDGKAKVFKDNKWYYINKSGKCIENCD